MTTPGRRFREALERALDGRDRHRAPVKRHRVLGRNTDGTLRLLSLDAECEQRGSVGKGYEGQIVVGPVSPSFEFRGAAGIAARRGNVGLSTLWIESLDPHLLPRGQTTTVTATGRGITPTTVVAFLNAADGGEPHPDITVVSTTYVSATELELEVAVSASAMLPVDVAGDPFLFAIAFDDPGR